MYVQFAFSKSNIKRSIWQQGTLNQKKIRYKNKTYDSLVMWLDDAQYFIKVTWVETTQLHSM